MQQQTRERVDAWWADVFGVPTSLVWAWPVVVGMHAGLGDYPGVWVASRRDRTHVSLPESFPTRLVDDLRQARPSDLLAPAFWRSLALPYETEVLGPAVHSYADTPPGVDHSLLEAVELLPVEDLDALRDDVSDEEWEESGLGGATPPVHALVDIEDTVVAAAHLGRFERGAGDVNVVVHPRRRREGWGRVVAGSATIAAVQDLGLARWRSRQDNTASRALSRGLGFEDYCLQLAVRPLG